MKEQIVVYVSEKTLLEMVSKSSVLVGYEASEITSSIEEDGDFRIVLAPKEPASCAP